MSGIRHHAGRQWVRRSEREWMGLITVGDVAGLSFLLREVGGVARTWWWGLIEVGQVDDLNGFVMECVGPGESFEEVADELMQWWEQNAPGKAADAMVRMGEELIRAGMFLRAGGKWGPDGEPVIPVGMSVSDRGRQGPHGEPTR